MEEISDDEAAKLAAEVNYYITKPKPSPKPTPEETKAMFESEVKEALDEARAEIAGLQAQLSSLRFRLNDVEGELALRRWFQSQDEGLQKQILKYAERVVAKDEGW